MVASCHMLLAALGFTHETNTFANHPTHYAAIQESCIFARPQRSRERTASRTWPRLASWTLASCRGRGGATVVHLHQPNRHYLRRRTGIDCRYQTPRRLPLRSGTVGISTRKLSPRLQHVRGATPGGTDGTDGDRGARRRVHVRQQERQRVAEATKRVARPSMSPRRQ